MDQNKEKQFQLAQAAVRKKYGEVSRWLSEMSESEREIISSGCISLDHALTTGGFVKGRLVEIFGQPSSGKSSLALNTAAQATRNGQIVLYIDMEHSLDPPLVKSFGVDENLFYYVSCYTGEECLDVMKTFIESQSVDMCVIDSITSMLPTAEATGDLDTNFIGLHARLVSKMCRYFVPLIGKAKTLLMAINQTRTKISGYGGGYQDPTGGNAIPFFASHRVKVGYKGGKSSAYLKDFKGNTIGHRVEFEVIKNKFGAPFKTAGADLIYGSGYELYLEIVELGLETGLLEQQGAWITFGDQKIQGRANMIETLKTNKEFCMKLLDDILVVLGMENKYL